MRKALGHKTDEGSGEEIDERLKNVDPKMVEVIMNEVSGSMIGTLPIVFVNCFQDGFWTFSTPKYIVKLTVNSLA